MKNEHLINLNFYETSKYPVAFKKMSFINKQTGSCKYQAITIKEYCFSQILNSTLF